MSTLTLVVLAVLTALFGLGALSLVRWRERKRLERAREIVRHTDLVISVGTLGNELEPWISKQMLNFLGSSIQRHFNTLELLKAPANKALLNSIKSAGEWMSNSRGPRQPLPSDPRQAQNIRNSVRNLLSYLRESYKEKQISSEEAKSLLQEARTLNIKISLAVLEEKIGTATKLNNHFQATHYLRKAEELLVQQKDLPKDFNLVLENIRQRLRKHEELRQTDTSTSRLEEGAAILSSEDNSWKKKRFD